MDRQDWVQGKSTWGKRQVGLQANCEPNSAKLPWLGCLSTLSRGSLAGGDFEGSLAHTPTHQARLTHVPLYVPLQAAHTCAAPLYTRESASTHISHRLHHTPPPAVQSRLTEADLEDGAGAFSSPGSSRSLVGLLRFGESGGLSPICSCLLPLWGNAYL